MSRTIHGLTFGPDGKRTALNRLWLNLRNRCNNPKTPDYKYYGARGIKVCERWNDFALFVKDVGPHPGEGWTLDRIDTESDYTPRNTRWATRKTQAQNRPYNKLDQRVADEIRQRYRREKVRQVDLAAEYGCSQGRISQIVRGIGWN